MLDVSRRNARAGRELGKSGLAAGNPTDGKAEHSEGAGVPGVHCCRSRLSVSYSFIVAFRPLQSRLPMAPSCTVMGTATLLSRMSPVLRLRDSLSELENSKSKTASNAVGDP